MELSFLPRDTGKPDVFPATPDLPLPKALETEQSGRDKKQKTRKRKKLQEQKVQREKKRRCLDPTRQQVHSLEGRAGAAA